MLNMTKCNAIMQFPKSMLSGYTALLQFLFSFFYITSCVVLFKLKLFRLFHSSNLTFHDISIISLIFEYVFLYKCTQQPSGGLGSATSKSLPRNQIRCMAESSGFGISH